MQARSLVTSSPGRFGTLADFKNWAFPHWVLWVAVLATFAVTATWLGLSARISIAPMWVVGNLVLSFGGILLIIFRAMRPQIFDWFLHRLWCVLLCTLISAVLMRNLQVLSHLIMSTNLPMADDTLMAWDKGLGFDWLAYSKFITSSPAVTSALFFAYNQLTFGGLAAVAAVIIALNMRRRSIEIIYLVVVTALICITTAAYFPARATMALLGDAELLSRLQIGTGVLHVEQLMALRGDGLIFMTPDNMQGLVSFPSFHTCMALIIAWCCRGHWLTSIVGIIVGAAIIAGTPIFGGHYLVDVLGGAAVFALALIAWRNWIEPQLQPRIANTTATSFPLPNWLAKRLTH
jgi:membrane-associated phospholipid phosphatase